MNRSRKRPVPRNAAPASAPLERQPQLELGFESALAISSPSVRGAIRRTLLADGWIVYRLERARRRTLAIYVDRHGVLARAPLAMPTAEIEAFLSQKSRWIRRRLRDSVQEIPAFSWRPGARFPVLGREVELAPIAGGSGARLAGERLEVGVDKHGDSAELREQTLVWIKHEARALFTERIAIYAGKLGVPLPRLRLSNARGQWGSCHEDGRVLLAWRLYHTPPALIDYVVAHELAHLKELNHSRRFWAVVARLYPDYEAARGELRQFGRRLPDLEAAR